MDKTALINAKIKASTLIEVIIAMVIILVMFALAMGIYTNVLRTTSAVKTERVKALTVQLLQQSITDANWKDADSLVDSVVLQKKVLPYGALRSTAGGVGTANNASSGNDPADEARVSAAENYAGLMVITVTAFEHDKEICRTRQIVKQKGNGN